MIAGRFAAAAGDLAKMRHQLARLVPEIADALHPCPIAGALLVAVLLIPPGA
jgi:hypothetical protein